MEALSIPLTPFANILLMSHEENEEKQERDERYKLSQGDARFMRERLDQVQASIGELMVAVKGNDLGTEGLVGQIKRMKQTVEEFDKRLEKIERDGYKEKFRMAMVFTLLGALGTSLIEWILEHLFKIK